MYIITPAYIHSGAFTMYNDWFMGHRGLIMDDFGNLVSPDLSQIRITLD